ncbi:MAG: hypothetical protein DHS20C17_16350 [Cyclobacteriaceae bacterium]|nr:MAG: hypothetical protein DHS20C17_16350 [Cyclobacteriaceae bacterium]
MKAASFEIRNARPSEFVSTGQMMVRVYSGLPGFPGPHEQPRYYQMLSQIGDQTKKPLTELIVAVSDSGNVLGGVVYFGDMQFYGSGGTAIDESNAAGFRLLAVDPDSRGLGIGKALSKECIKRAKESGQKQVIIHSTKSMQIAWKMYEKLGFKRSQDLDFNQESLPVFGFRLVFAKSL